MEVRITEVSFWESDLARSSYAHKALITYRDDISLRQSIPQGKKLAVDKVSLTIAPGTVTCVHGYGLGPQNLIRILALQPSVFGHLSGSITYDDSIRSIGAYCDIAFIAKRKIQSLLHIHVFDYLYYAARLRTTLGTHECRSRAVEAARIVGLDLGTKLQHLKMGQRVQLLIASELVGQPTLICLDDPLSGLDEFSAQEVIDSLTRIARRQYSPTTIVFTVSQPGHCLLRGVNRLIVFANAKVVFNRDISVLSITSTASPHGKTTAPSSPETASNAPRFSDFSRRSPQPTSPLLRPSALGAEDAHGYMEQSSGEDTSNASDVRYIEDQISLGLCSVETRLLAVAGDNVPQNILLLTQREAEQIVRSVCDELSMFIDKCVTRLGGTVENDNDTQEIILSPITKQSSSILTKSTSSSSSSISSRGENHSADKARRQLRQGFGGGFVRAPKKTLDDVAILIWRSKHDLFNNVSQ
jgi:ABC-type multidrug transport system ATPase subunit